MKHIEIIKVNDEIAAYIIRSSYEPDSSVFLTPSTLEMQAGFIVYKKGTNITPHYHLPSHRIIKKTTECILVKRGRCWLDLYNDQNDLVSTHDLMQNDIVMLVNGGHGFRMQEDTILFEIKQGPYLEQDDKVKFEKKDNEIKNNINSA
jgi:cupin fold WbuC family metalloprotein